MEVFFFGEAVEELEKALCQLTQRKHAVLVGSCTDALFFSLKAYGIGEGDEVLVTSFSHMASGSSILRTGAQPVFVDICRNDFMMDLDLLSSVITKKTKAILAVHMFGQSLDMTRVEEIAANAGLLLVEDAAQSIGADFEKRPVGNLGNASCLSFDPLKSLASMGYGGAVVTDDLKVAESVERLRHHGRGKSANNDYDVLGYNSKMPTLDAAVTLHRLEKMKEESVRRQEIAKLYNQGLAELPQLNCPKESVQGTHIWHKYNLLCEQRDQLEDFLKEKGVGTRRCWPMPLYREKAYHTGKEFNLKEVEGVCRDLLTLPLYAEMTNEEVVWVIKSIKEFYGAS